MKATALTVRRLLNRLPEPRRASLRDLGHAAAMSARAARATTAPDPKLTAVSAAASLAVRLRLESEDEAR